MSKDKSNKSPFSERVKEYPFTERLKRRNWKKDWSDQYVFLGNKLNAKIFASNLGIAVPKTYGVMTSLKELPPNLPQSWVMKPLRGHSGGGMIVCVNGTDILRNKKVDNALIERVMTRYSRQKSVSFRKAPPVWIFEEYLADDFMIPTGFKVYAFGEHVAAIRVNVPKEKIGNNDKWDSCSFYLPDWTRSPFIINKYGTTGCGVSGPVEDVPMPAGLEQLILDASTLGEAYGTFCRIDFFMINGMPIFNEFCWYPLAGWGNTLEGEKWLGQIWEEHLGDDKL